MIASALIFLFLYALSGNTHTDASRECPPSFKISYSFQLVADRHFQNERYLRVKQNSI